MPKSRGCPKFMANGSKRPNLVDLVSRSPYDWGKKNIQRFTSYSKVPRVGFRAPYLPLSDQHRTTFPRLPTEDVGQGESSQPCCKIAKRWFTESRKHRKNIRINMAIKKMFESFHFFRIIEKNNTMEVITKRKPKYVLKKT